MDVRDTKMEELKGDTLITYFYWTLTGSYYEKPLHYIISRALQIDFEMGTLAIYKRRNWNSKG